MCIVHVRRGVNISCNNLYQFLLSVLLFTDSGCPFGIFKLFLVYCNKILLNLINNYCNIS